MKDINIRQLRRFDRHSILMVGTSLAFLRDDYPHFEDWYNQTVVPYLEDTRMVFLASPQDDHNRFAGAMILKKTFDEKKICTLYVHRDFCRRGIGTAFMDIALEELGVCYPVITVSELREVDFAPLLQNFKFKLWDRYNGYYRSGIHELSYNGPIEPITKEIGCFMHRHVSQYIRPFT